MSAKEELKMYIDSLTPEQLRLVAERLDDALITNGLRPVGLSVGVVFTTSPLQLFEVTADRA